MSYTDDALRAKLSSLNEAQDTIVTVAQWILFHKRMANRTAELWLAKVNDTPPGKRLSLIYLANEVVQQSKARKKDEFPSAFTPLIAEGTAVAYKGAPLDLQQKIRRVVEVWRQRFIFDEKTQVDVEAKLDEIDRTRASSKRGGLGGSLFSGGASAGAIPPRLQNVSALYTTLSTVETNSTTSQATFSTNEEAVRNNVTSLPIKAAQLNSLLNSLNDVENSVAESIRARQNLIAGLEKLIVDNKTSLSKDEQQVETLNKKRSALKAEKDHIEQVIIRGGDEAAEPPRPEAEAITPPPIESITPPGSPKAVDDDSTNLNGDAAITATTIQSHITQQPTVAGTESFAAGMKHENGTTGSTEQPSTKKRKLEQVDDFGTLNDEEDAFGKLDPEVEALLAGN